MRPYSLKQLIQLSGLWDDYERLDWCLAQVEAGAMAQDSEGLFCPRPTLKMHGMGHDY